MKLSQNFVEKSLEILKIVTNKKCFDLHFVKAVHDFFEGDFLDKSIRKVSQILSEENTSEKTMLELRETQKLKDQRDEFKLKAQEIFKKIIQKLFRGIWNLGLPVKSASSKV